MVVSFLRVESKSKRLRENRKKLSFWKNFDLTLFDMAGGGGGMMLSPKCF